MEQTRTYGWFDLLKGILLLLAGITLLCVPEIVVSGLALLGGLAILIVGILNLWLYAKTRTFKSLYTTELLIIGIVSTLLGLILTCVPVIGQAVLNVVIPLWFIIYCLARIASYEAVKAYLGRSVAVISLCLNILGLLVGIVTLFNPMLFTLSLALLVALNLMAVGVGCLVEAIGGFYKSRSHAHTHSQP